MIDDSTADCNYACSSSAIAARSFSTICTVSDSLRIFSFKKELGVICIDFAWYRVTPGWLYVVPAGHRIYMPQALLADCVCQEMKPELLPEEVQSRLFKLQFAAQKAVSSDDVIATALANAENGSAFPRKSSLPMDWYQKIAAGFCEKIAATRLSQMTATADLAALLNIPEKTLRRACLDIFGVTPAVILRYYLTLNAVELLAETGYRIKDVSKLLQFSDTSKCSRFLKGRMGMCPEEFRQQIQTLLKNQ